MCCRLTVTPLVPEIAKAVLLTGMFETQENGTFIRRIPEEGLAAHVIARLETESNCLRLEIWPSISQYQHHHEKRIAGGVYFEIAAKYAEKVGGRIEQLSNVIGCTESGVDKKLLAQYPDQPLLWERVCAGFQEAILGSAEAL